ncbi:MAG: putative membrane protein YhiD involved in acid resistance [Maribacter sp.]|jgi:uncharacterized membrane protein YhiD involved in acid resistance
MEGSIFEQYLEQFTNTVDLTSFIINLIVATILTIVVQYYYLYFGSAVSNRKKFASIFLPLALGTMLIITIIQSSVALSLGLVGALSIVRFRAAIKDPEELTFLFLVIGIGLANGANKPILATIAILLILLLLWLSKFIYKQESFKTEDKMYINISTDKENIEEIVALLSEDLPYVELKRMDSLSTGLDVSFICKAESVAQLESVRKKIRGMSEKTTVSFIDQPNLII